MKSRWKSRRIYISCLSFIFFWSVADQGGNQQSAPKVAISVFDYSRGSQSLECENGCSPLEIQRLNTLGMYPVCVRLYNQESAPVMLSGQSFNFAPFDYEKIAESFYINHQLTPFPRLESIVVGSALTALFPADLQELLKHVADPFQYSRLIFGFLGGFTYWSYVATRNNALLSFMKKVSSTQSSGKHMMLPPGQLVRFFMFLSRAEYMNPFVLYLRNEATQKDEPLCYLQLNMNEKTLMYQKIDQLSAPQEVKQEMWEILERLDRIPVESPESHMTRTHLEWLLSLPWGTFTEDCFDLERAQAILDADHAGLQEVKDTILEFIAVRKLNPNSVPPIMCLVGPPGIGKTSLVSSIATSLNRKFARISLGGMHDEAEMRGHRRTYIGAMPGRVIQAMRTAASSNPVILLDEVDKMGNHNSQAALSALLEVLDPSQNKNFRDTYLGIPFDLSRVLFVATANSIGDIPAPLRDRMEIVMLPGYSLEEKLVIAQNYLVPRSFERAGLNMCDMSIDDGVIREIIGGYTVESGVRELGRQLNTLCAKAARIFVERGTCITIDVDSLETYLGPKKVRPDDIGKKDTVGMVNGLAWTPYGGVMLRLEAVLVPGEGKLKLTGQLGDVMKESVQAAFTYVRVHATALGIDAALFKENDVHIHVPAGATPKDGPSAGIGMITALVSVLTGKKFDARYAMTGEIDLHGNVLPIGGVKEKLLAAKRFGIANVILPCGNKPDVVGKEELLEGLNIIWVDRAEQVLALVFNKG